MGNDVNLHQGHRARMIEKFLENPNAFADHEILEIFLFNIIPRVNTNPTAHRLLRTFGSLTKIFSASAQELMSVEGVGKSTATALITVGKMINKIIEERTAVKRAGKFSFYDSKDEIIADFNGLLEEVFIIYLLDDKLNKITSIKFANKERFAVMIDISELAKAIAVHRPKYAIIAHNHPSGNAMPSIADDMTTKKVNLICSLHGVNLVDHVIVSGKEAFSYRSAGRLYGLQEKADIEKLLN